jgi:hypothetical protein
VDWDTSAVKPWQNGDLVKILRYRRYLSTNEDRVAPDNGGRQLNGDHSLYGE